MINKMPRIGIWVTMCCTEDMFLIETQDQLDEILEELADGEFTYYFVETEQEAREKWTVN